MCGNCWHPQHTHHMDFGRCNQPIGRTWICGCLHYEAAQ